jgi:hypothetical protein
MLTGTLTGLRRLSLVGAGYTALAHESPAFRLLSGAPRRTPGAALSTDPSEVNDENRDVQRFVAVLDMPMQNLPEPFVIVVGALVATVAWRIGWISTIDGSWFSRFATLATWAALITALLLTAQGWTTWNVLRPTLQRLSHTPLARALSKIGHLIRWDLSIAPPRLSELMPVAARAERIRCGLLAIANGRLGRRRLPSRDRRRQPNPAAFDPRISEELRVRSEDLTGLARAFDSQSPLDSLRAEIIERTNAPLLASDAWRDLWRTADRLVELLESVHWRRHTVMHEPAPPTAALESTDAGRTGPQATAADCWFAEREEFVAIQCAFVVRDVIARIMSSLFAAMLVLTLVASAHLFYLFQGRASLLTVDVAAITAVAVLSIPVVVAMERDVILSMLRLTTPGRINFNWDFVRQVATYGLLPLIAVIASLFPEVGGSLFSWLEPLRKLAAP